MMIEYVDPQERAEKLKQLRGIEDRTYVQVSGHDRVYAISDEDLERSNADKTSAVHFMRFELTRAMIDAVKAGAAIAMGIDLPAYACHIDEVSPETQGALAQDLV